MMRIRNILIVASIGFVSSGCAFLQKRMAIKDLRVDLRSITVKALTLDRIELDVGLNAYNPNDIEAVIDRLDYTVYLEDRRAMEGSSDRQYRIPPNGSKKIHLKATIRLIDLPNVFMAIKEAAKKGKVKARADIRLHIKTMFGTFTRSIKLERIIPLDWR